MPAVSTSFSVRQVGRGVGTVLVVYATLGTIAMVAVLPFTYEMMTQGSPRSPRTSFYFNLLLSTAYPLVALSLALWVRRNPSKLVSTVLFLLIVSWLWAAYETYRVPWGRMQNPGLAASVAMVAWQLERAWKAPLVITASALVIRSAFRRAVGGVPLCADCGYRLTGLASPTCPECGKSYTLDEFYSLNR